MIEIIKEKLKNKSYKLQPKTAISNLTGKAMLSLQDEIKKDYLIYCKKEKYYLINLNSYIKEIDPFLNLREVFLKVAESGVFTPVILGNGNQVNIELNQKAGIKGMILFDLEILGTEIKSEKDLEIEENIITENIYSIINEHQEKLLNFINTRDKLSANIIKDFEEVIIICRTLSKCNLASLQERIEEINKIIEKY